MRIYLSSIAPQIILDLYNIRDDLKLNVLQPFVFRNNQGIDATLWSAMKGITNSIFLDSGTFELFNKSDLYDVEECFNKYALSLDSLHGVFDLYANFDPDYKSNDRFIVNLSFQNRLEEMGFMPIPVMHSKDDEEIEFYLKSKYDLIAISAQVVNRLSSKSINMIVDRFNAVGKRVHLLGIGSYAKLKDSNAWSCDCSSFIRWAASGRAIFFSEIQQKEVTLSFSSHNKNGVSNSDYYNNLNNKPLRDEYENFIAYEVGFDLNDVAADTSKLVMLNALYLKLREEVITQRQKDRSIQFGVW